jgi:hypothetical protein
VIYVETVKGCIMNFNERLNPNQIWQFYSNVKVSPQKNSVSGSEPQSSNQPQIVTETPTTPSTPS